MSNMTWGQAKSDVAQVVGGQGDPDTLQLAQAQISAVLQDWNTRRNWQFLQTIADDIAVTAGTSTYDLPAAFKRPYAAIFNTDSLVYVTRRQFNRVDAVQSASQPYWYTLFNHAETGKIELIPPCGVSGVLKVWYYRLMTEIGPDGDLLDVLGRYTNYVLDAAKTRILATKGPVDKMQFWMGAAESGFMKAVADDEHIPDEDPGFRPQMGLTSVPSDNSFQWVDWGW
jgi:hypothetical protein